VSYPIIVAQTWFLESEERNGVRYMCSKCECDKLRHPLGRLSLVLLRVAG
jgi:hypothetical protein